MLIRGEKPLTEQSGFFKDFLRYLKQKSRVFWCFRGQKVPKNPKKYGNLGVAVTRQVVALESSVQLWQITPKKIAA